eukprot:332861-Prorocentrum_minimum.AAC.1
MMTFPQSEEGSENILGSGANRRRGASIFPGQLINKYWTAPPFRIRTALRTTVTHNGTRERIPIARESQSRESPTHAIANIY